MAQLAVDQIREFRVDMDGPVIVAADADFDGARRVWNAEINRYPAAIARCVSAADVAAAVAFARANGLAVSVRGGAHNTAGTAVCDNGALQQMLDEANAWASHAYEKGTYVEDLSDDVTDILTAHVAAKTSPQSTVLLYRPDGAYSDVADDATAFGGGRSPRFAVFIIGMAPDAASLELERRWVTRFWDSLQPHTISNGDGYVNGTTDYSADRVRGSYGPRKYERLARIKAVYDPDNVFHVNANIGPART